MGRYFEQFEAGEEFVTRGRTITEADIAAFSGLSGDFTELHTNVEYARQTRYGRPMAHGLLTLSVSSGLWVQSGIVEGTVVAFYGIDKLRFVRAVFPGDTITVRQKVVETRERDPDAGVVVFDTEVVNQSGEVVLAYRKLLLVRRREPGPAKPA